jgi:hypothetical protein
MLTREIELLPGYLYPVDEWRLVENRFSAGYLPQMETLFSTANGFLGIRGCHEEGSPVYDSGTLINGFHETWPIIYGEEAFGFARTGQTIVNAPDAKILRLYVDDEPFDLSKVNLLRYERVLDMRTGILERTVVWEKFSGKQIQIRSRRLVSFVHRHAAAIDYEVTLLNADAPLVIASELRCAPDRPRAANDPRASRFFTEKVLLPRGHHARDARLVQGYVTRNSGMTLACGVDHRLETDCPHRVECFLRRRTGPGPLCGRGPAREDGAAQQVPDLPRLPQCPGPGTPRAGRSRLGSFEGRWLRVALPGTAAIPRRVLGSRRCPDRRRPRHPTGDPVQPLPHLPGKRTGRERRDSRPKD